MIRVLLAEDHPVVRVGLERLLASVEDIDVVGAASNGAEAVESCATLRPDVVLMDISMPEVGGVEATARIRAEHDDAISVVILTSFANREHVLAALDAGALGYLLKDADSEELIRGIRAAARGESPLAPKAARELIDRRSEGRTAPELSSREREVLVLVARGLPNKQIALELSITEKTVKSHLTNIFGRLGVTDRYQAALWAIRHGVADA